MTTLVDTRPTPPAVAALGERRAPGSSPRAARADLRAQIARLEQRLAAYAPSRSAARGEPRLPGVAELERIRDGLVAAIDDARRDEQARTAREAQARRALEAMLADPRTHRRRAVALHELGVPGCGVYRPRPRLGLVGRLAGWWRVTLSSGCP